MKKTCIAILVILLFASCRSNNDWKKRAENPNFIHRSVRQVTDVMLHDIYSPPVASRIYAYITVAGYEAAVNGSKNYISLSGQLNGLDSVPKPKAGKQYCYALAASHAILTVGK
ncbi:MAG: phosphatidic acid phosphatase, partial [Mucilaginibacter sp.]|nr:phosphatidic acid phosphatase [Mucilaginibacter sp.]